MPPAASGNDAAKSGETEPKQQSCGLQNQNKELNDRKGTKELQSWMIAV